MVLLDVVLAARLANNFLLFYKLFHRQRMLCWCWLFNITNLSLVFSAFCDFKSFCSLNSFVICCENSVNQLAVTTPLSKTICLGYYADGTVSQVFKSSKTIIASVQLYYKIVFTQSTNNCTTLITNILMPVTL